MWAGLLGHRTLKAWRVGQNGILEGIKALLSRGSGPTRLSKGVQVTCTNRGVKAVSGPGQGRPTSLGLTKELEGPDCNPRGPHGSHLHPYLPYPTQLQKAKQITLTFLPPLPPNSTSRLSGKERWVLCGSLMWPLALAYKTLSKGWPHSE